MSESTSTPKAPKRKKPGGNGAPARSARAKNPSTGESSDRPARPPSAPRDVSEAMSPEAIDYYHHVLDHYGFSPECAHKVTGHAAHQFGWRWPKELSDAINAGFRVEPDERIFAGGAPPSSFLGSHVVLREVLGKHAPEPIVDDSEPLLLMTLSEVSCAIADAVDAASAIGTLACRAHGLLRAGIGSAESAEAIQRDDRFVGRDLLEIESLAGRATLGLRKFQDRLAARQAVAEFVGLEGGYARGGKGGT